jgi:predicted transcriptional regulator of viral defense system
VSKFEALEALLKKNSGFIKTADAQSLGISRPYFGEFVREQGLERVSHGLYMSQDAWADEMFVIQSRYPDAVFSHETALYLLNLADREPLQLALTLKTGTNSAALNKQGVKVYKVRELLFAEGITTAPSPAHHELRVYNAERTLCDIIRSRRNIEIQDIQTTFKEYTRQKERNIPLLMRYAEAFSVEKIVRQYLEVLL